MELLVACNLEDLVEEVNELDHLLVNIEGGEGSTDDHGVGAYDIILVNAKTYMVAELKDLCKSLLIASTRNKFQQIWYCSSTAIEKINDESFYYRKKKGEDVDLSLPRLIILNPKPATSADGVDMRCGAEERFFGPTIVVNAEGVLKFQYASLRQRFLTYKFPTRGIFLQPLKSFCLKKSKIVILRTSLILRSLLSLSRGASLIQRVHEWRRRELVSAEASTVQVLWSSVLEWPIPTSKDCHVV